MQPFWLPRQKQKIKRSEGARCNGVWEHLMLFHFCALAGGVSGVSICSLQKSILFRLFTKKKK